MARDRKTPVDYKDRQDAQGPSERSIDRDSVVRAGLFDSKLIRKQPDLMSGLR